MGAWLIVVMLWQQFDLLLLLILLLLYQFLSMVSCTHSYLTVAGNMYFSYNNSMSEVVFANKCRHHQTEHHVLMSIVFCMGCFEWDMQQS